MTLSTSSALQTKQGKQEEKNISVNNSPMTMMTKKRPRSISPSWNSSGSSSTSPPTFAACPPYPAQWRPCCGGTLLWSETATAIIQFNGRAHAPHAVNMQLGWRGTDLTPPGAPVLLPPGGNGPQHSITRYIPIKSFRHGQNHAIKFPLTTSDLTLRSWTCVWHLTQFSNVPLLILRSTERSSTCLSFHPFMDFRGNFYFLMLSCLSAFSKSWNCSKPLFFWPNEPFSTCNRIRIKIPLPSSPEPPGLLPSEGFATKMYYL